MSIYEWADDIRPAVMARLKEMCGNEFPDPYEVVGIAVLNADTGEAEYYSLLEVDGSVLAIDALSDIANDAENMRVEQVMKWRAVYDQIRTRHAQKRKGECEVINGDKS